MAGHPAGNDQVPLGPESSSVPPASGHEPPKRKSQSPKQLTTDDNPFINAAAYAAKQAAARNETETSTVSTPSDVDKPSVQPLARKLVPQPHGGALMPGAGGGPQPGSGRPPNAFKDFLRKMRENPKVQQHLQDTLEGGGNKSAYAAALKLIADYDPELPSNLTPEERKARVLELVREGARRKKAAEAAGEGTSDA